MRKSKHLILLVVLLCTVTTVWADDWPEYITDVVVIAAKDNDEDRQRCIEEWEDKGYTVIKKDLNKGVAVFFSNVIYLAYKTAERASTNGSYITDFVVLNTSDPPATWKHDGRTYYKCPSDDNCYYKISFDGNLNYLVTGAWDLYLYYTKDNYDDKRVVSGITFDDTQHGSVDCFNVDGSMEEADIDLNRGAIGSYIYMHLTTPTKTNRPQKDPYARGGLKYNGEDQVLVGGCTIESGTMYYRVGETGEFVDDVNKATGKNAGTYTVYYYASPNDYSIQSDVHSKSVTIAKASNGIATVSCEPTLVQDTPSPIVTGNMSTGAITYLYSTAEDGEYSTTIPSTVGIWWVKANISGDENYNEFTTTPVSFSMTNANLVFADNADNSSVIDSHNGESVAATISGRTLYTNEQWNTLCLPFDLVLEGSPLENAIVKTLTSTSFHNGTLTMNFSDDLTSIEAGKPYIVKWSPTLVISTPDDWNAFAQQVNDGMEDYRGQTVIMDADMEVSEMVGNSSHQFRGIFDGRGHTLTFNNGSAPEYGAPFRYVNGATINNLRVVGTITTSSKFAAGIIANTIGNTTVNNCRSSVTITSSISGDGTHGGLIAHINSGQVIVSNCLFDGKLLGSNTTNCGGFVGWTESDNGATVNFQYCYFNPAELNLGSGCKTFARARNNASISSDHMLYDTPLGEEQGIYAGTMNIVTLWQNLGDGWKLSGTTLVPRTDKEPVNVTNPFFSLITLDNTLKDVETDYVDFVGCYSPVEFVAQDKSILYMGSDNKLYYPKNNMTIKSFRGYFKLKGIEVGDLSNNAKAIVLNFGDDNNPTGINIIDNNQKTKDDAWYTLDGRRLTGKPTHKGIYINNGKKVVIK